MPRVKQVPVPGPRSLADGMVPWRVLEAPMVSCGDECRGAMSSQQACGEGMP